MNRRYSPGILSALFAALALLMAVAGYTYYKREARSVQTQRYSELRTISSLKISQITDWRDERCSDARFSARHLAAHREVLKWLAHPAGTAPNRDTIRELGLIRDSGHYRNVLLVAMDGTLLLSIDPGVRSLEPEARELVRHVQASGQAMLGDLVRNPGLAQVYLDIAAPVSGPNGNTVAVLLLRANPESRLFPLIQSWPTPSESAETLLVRREGDEVLFLNLLRHSAVPALTFRQPLSRADLPAAHAVKGRVGEFIGTDYRGVEVLADLQPIHGSSWFMIAKVETREILAEARYRGRVILGFVGIGILMLGILLGFLIYLGQAKLYQNLFQATPFERDPDSGVPAHRVRRARHMARIAGIAGMAVGCLVLAGWTWDIEALKSLLPGFVTMKANTAIGLLLAGTALCLHTSPLRHSRSWAQACAGALALLGVLNLVQYLFGVDLHIDQILFHEPPGTIGTLAPGRMAPATAVSFMLIGCGLILARSRRTIPASQWLALPVALFSLLSLLGYSYGSIGTYGLGYYFQLALLTALALILLSLGLCLLTPSEGFMRSLLNESRGGWLLRRTLPVLSCFALLIGWTRSLGERLGWYESAVGRSLVVLAFLSMVLITLWWAARSLDRMDSIRSQAEARLRERAEEIRITLYGIGDGVIAADAEGLVIHMNPAAEELTGWSEAESIGTPLETVFQIVEEETMKPLENPLRRVLREGQIIELTNHTLLIARDGSKRALANSAAPVRNDRGDIVRVVLSFRDQTEKRRMDRLAKIRTDLNDYADTHTLDELLTRTLDEAGALVESPIGFYHFYDEKSGNLTLQQWSTQTLKEFCKAEGRGSHYGIEQAGVWTDCIRSHSPVIHNDYASLPHRKGLPPGHAEVVRELVVPVMRAGKVVAILGVGNKPFDYNDKDMDTVSFLAETTWAIIERKMVNTALEESENRFRRLHESMRDAYAQVDMDGYVVDCNSLFQEMLGYSGDELRQLTYRDLTPPEWHAMEAAILQNEVLVHGYSKVYEKSYHRKDGVVFPVELRTNLLTDTDGKPVGMWAIVRDITDRKRAEMFLQEAERTAKGTLNALTEHLAILDEDGTILDVNEAWRRFAKENPPLRKPVCEGANYFQVCAAATGPDADVAAAFMEGIRSVMEGRRAEYTQEYACHSPEIQRWFSGRVTRFAGDGPLRIVVAHENITERKTAENAMLAALAEADRFKTAMDHLSAFVYIKNRLGHYVYANRPTLERFKCSAEELIGSGDSRFFSQATVARLHQVDTRVIEEGKETAEEITDLGADGVQRVYWEVKTPIYVQGEIWGLCGISTDITELKQTEHSLRETEERLKFALDGSNDGWWDAEMATGALYLSPRTCELLGYPPEAGGHIAQTWVEMIHPDDLAKTDEALQDYLDGRTQLFSVEQRLRSASGEWKWILTRGKSVAWDTAGSSLRMVGTHTDITERKRAEEIIQAKTELLDMTGAMAKVGGWEFDPVTLQGTWTDETARIHDMDPSQEVDATKGLTFYSESSRPKIAHAVREAIESGKPYDLELELISAKGIHKMVRTVGTPVRDEHGKIVKVQGMLQDITEMKAAEKQIRASQAETQRLLENADQSRKALLSLVEDQKASEEQIRKLNADLENRVAARTLELAAANKELEAFAYSVSHDLRSPLRHMEGFLTMLARHLGDNLDDKGSHYLKVAQGASVRMGQLVEGLLSFSRLGRAELRMVPVDTAELVSAVIEESKTEWGNRAIHWEVGELPVLQGDPTLLRLVFQNLVGNALKFTRDRAKTLIEIQPLEGLTGETGISIRDNGVGFDPAYAHKLFGVFQRLHREDEFEGTGIGLANVHRIVTRHGGRVWAEGRQGEGATFFMAFPSREEQA